MLSDPRRWNARSQRSGECGVDSVLAIAAVAVASGMAVRRAVPVAAAGGRGGGAAADRVPGGAPGGSTGRRSRLERPRRRGWNGGGRLDAGVAPGWNRGWNSWSGAVAAGTAAAWHGSHWAGGSWNGGVWIGPAWGWRALAGDRVGSHVAPVVGQRGRPPGPGAERGARSGDWGGRATGARRDLVGAQAASGWPWSAGLDSDTGSVSARERWWRPGRTARGTTASIRRATSRTWPAATGRGWWSIRRPSAALPRRRGDVCAKGT